MSISLSFLLIQNGGMTFVNPRRACAARVIVLGSVCVCVCVCPLSHISLHELAIEL